MQEFSADNLELVHGENRPEPRLPNADEVQLLDTALSSILDFAYIFDRDGRFIYVNQPLLNLWGLKLKDAVGKNFFDLGYPEDLAAKLQRQIQQVIETRQGLTDETPYTSPAGVAGYYEYIFRPVLEPDGAVSMVAGSTRDISERKRAEEDLRRTQARLESALKAGLAGTFYWDISKDRIITDENMRRYFSLSEQSLGEGVALAEMLLAIHDDDRAKVEQALTEAIQRTGSYSIEYRILHSDGSMRWLSARGLIERDQEGRAIGLPGFTIDITERKSAEEAIRFQAHLLNTVEQAVIATNLDGTITYWNKFAEQLYGWSSVEVIGRNVIEAVSSGATREQAAEIMDQLRKGESWSGEFMVRRRDKTVFPAMVTNTPIHDDEERLVGIVGVSTNIAERKFTMSLLQKSHEELERRVGERTLALSEMNAVLKDEVRERRRIEGERVELLRRIVFTQEDERRRIAREMHDQLGQQLTVLKLKLDAVKEGCGENAKLCEQVDSLQALARQLDEDVDHMVWEMRPTALDDLGLQAALSSYVQNWSKNLSVPVQLHASGMDKERLTPEIETALYRIAQEALNNIAKHAQATQVAIVLERRADQVSLIIEDDGVGFDLQQLLSADDIGLGLVGLRERAALFGGTVEIESQLNEGATIVVRIPIPPARQTGETNG